MTNCPRSGSPVSIFPALFAFAALLAWSPGGKAFGQTPDPAPPVASSNEGKAVLAPVQAMLDAMARRDPAALKAQWLPGGMLTLMRNGKPQIWSVDTFLGHLKPNTATVSPAIEERIHDPLIRIDNDLAVVWAPFDFLVNGKQDHCGTDLFDLVRVDGRWLIASATDTGRNTCPAR